MNAATIAGVASTLMFAGSTLPMVVRAARTRDVSSYSRSHLFMTNAGNAVHTVYIASLPPGPVWLLHCMYSGVAAFMFAAHVRWAPNRTAIYPASLRAGSHSRWHRAKLFAGRAAPPCGQACDIAGGRGSPRRPACPPRHVAGRSVART